MFDPASGQYQEAKNWPNRAQGCILAPLRGDDSVLFQSDGNHLVLLVSPQDL